MLPNRSVGGFFSFSPLDLEHQRMAITLPRYPGTPVRKNSSGLALTPTLGESLLRSATYLNDVSPTFTNASANRFNPFDKTFAGANVRRRRPLYVGRNHQVQMDLIEGSRTNLLLRSQEIDNASWVKGSSSVSPNSSTAPDGSTTADTLIEANAHTSHYITQSVIVASGVMSLSVFAKASTRSRVVLEMYDGIQSVYAIFDLSAGTVASSVTGGSWSGSSFVIEDVGGGWSRCSVRATRGVGTTTTCTIWLNAGGSLSYAGDGTSGLYLWGAQLEAAPFPSTYIPTTTVAVTRAADVLSTTLDDLAGGVLSDTEGTIVAAIVPVGWSATPDAVNNARLLQDADLSTDIRILFGAGAGNSVNSYRDDAGGNQFTDGLITFSNGVLNSYTLKWDADALTNYASGVQIGIPDTTLTAPYDTVSAITIGDALGTGRACFSYLGLFYFPRSLSATEVAAIPSALRI